MNNKKAGKATGNLVGLEREWAVGRKLNLLDEDDGFLEGFMQTGSKVLDKDGSFMGMVLEKLNGGDVLKRLDDPMFNDVDYILAMVMQVRNQLGRLSTSLKLERGWLIVGDFPRKGGKEAFSEPLVINSQ